MKKKLFSAITLLTLLGVLAVPSVRSEAAAKEKPVGKRTLAKYDTDKDGKLSDQMKVVRFIFISETVQTVKIQLHMFNLLH